MIDLINLAIAILAYICPFSILWLIIEIQRRRYWQDKFFEADSKLFNYKHGIEKEEPKD